MFNYSRTVIIMTKKDALQILAVLKAAYPSSYNGLTKEEATGIVAVWCMQFTGVPTNVVMMAVHKLISTCKFPPSISEIKDKIRTIHWEAYDALLEHSHNPFLSEKAEMQYRQIYETTRDYKNVQDIEPKIWQMLSCADGEPLKIQNGE